MKEGNKQVEKPVATDANLAIKMRPESRGPMAQKLKDVKDQKPHFNEMANGLEALVTPVSSAVMTSKAKDCNLKLKRMAPFKLNASPGSVPLLDTSQLKRILDKMPSVEATQQLEAQFSEDQIRHAIDLCQHFTRQLGSQIEVVVGIEPRSLVATPEPMETEEVAVAEVPQEVFEPIDQLDPLEMTQEDPELPESEQLHQAEQPELSEILELEEQPDGTGPMGYMESTMFLLQPDGSYNLYTTQEPITEEMQPMSVRQIGIDDGPLIILTGGDGPVHYNATDTVAIDINESSVYILDTEESVVCYVEDSEGNVHLDMDSLIEYLPEEQDATVETVSSNGVYTASPIGMMPIPPPSPPATEALSEGTPVITALLVEGPVLETGVMDASVMATAGMMAPVMAAPVMPAPVIAAPVMENAVNEKPVMEEPVPSTSARCNTGKMKVDTFDAVVEPPLSQAPNPGHPNGSSPPEEEGKRKRHIPWDHDYAKCTWETIQGFTD
ncbi:uncharacterized protein Dana_GF26261, isoform B [Drosophila ananassae]|uniref:Uncharacterized protein, isoform B n=1 Tax=Drosophila ananassae TaxID=7217 RepID=A0A0P8ZJU6_DROAN|nr:fibrous sheath CABYR-binding protein [Drosophila ananassae]KPU75107.1 uncharacterized protein Dana_GF26261, isoform B [Drosophila ananassae]